MQPLAIVFTTMSGVGRKRSQFENNFTTLSSDTKKKKVQCKKCGYTSMWNATRLKDHVEKCFGATETAVKREILSVDAEVASVMSSPSAVTPTCDSSPSTFSPSPSPGTSATQPQQSKFTSRSSITGLSSFVCTMSRTKQEGLKRKLAKSIYTSGVPFRYVENPHFLDWASEMNPAFKVPTRREIAGKLLTDEDASTTAFVRHRIESAPERSLTLVTDGWTNVTGESIVNYVVCDPKPMFLDSVAPKEKHTGKGLVNN